MTLTVQTTMKKHLKKKTSNEMAQIHDKFSPELLQKP
jgi:hypothetical protein